MLVTQRRLEFLFIPRSDEQEALRDDDHCHTSQRGKTSNTQDVKKDQSCKEVNTHPLKNAHSYPILTALEKELTKLHLEMPINVMKPTLQAVNSVDSAVDSAGSECELDALDDDLVAVLHLERSRPTFVV